MDAAYDADEIRACSRDLGHTVIIAVNPRRSIERKEAMKRRQGAPRATCLPPSDATMSARQSSGSMGASRACPELDSGSSAGACQEPALSLTGGVVPSHVRHPGADGQPVDAPVAAAPALIGLAHPDRSAIPASLETTRGEKRPQVEEKAKAEAGAHRIRRAPNPRWHVPSGTMRCDRLMPL